MPTLLYISGSGRSGSTLLERLLHANGRLFAAGELHVLWRLPINYITCSCGTSLHDCDTWSQVLRRSGTFEQIAELAQLESVVCRTRFIHSHRFDPARLARNVDVARFLHLQRALFDTLAAATGKDVIVDSSKAGPRAFLLSCLANSKVIHLRRDPVDVISSWRSMKFDKGLGEDMRRLSVARATADWMKSEYFAGRIAAHRQVGFVDYAEFCANPRGTMAAVAATLRVDLDGVIWRGESRFEPAGGYHSLNGNPDRFSKGAISIVPRSVNRSAMSVSDRVSSRALGTLAKRLFPAQRQVTKRAERGAASRIFGESP